MKVSVSFIKSIYDIKKTIQKIINTDADYIHVDLMDGLFVKNKTFTIEELTTLLLNNPKKLDIHLMVEDPYKYIEGLKHLNVEYFTFHIETVEDPLKIINIIHQANIKCGITLKPNTPLNSIEPYLDLVDQVLIMSVEPGQGGQEFLTNTINILKQINQNKRNFIINIDGGINDKTVELVRPYVDMVVSGSFICMSEDYQRKINILKDIN